MPQLPSSFLQAAEKTHQFLLHELQKIRTGRASVSMLDEVTVEAYGTRMKLTEVASLSTPDPTLIVISPWDKSLLTAIEKAITISGLNLQPAVDSEIIRVPVPALTQEKRQELVKVTYKKLEEAKIMLRNARQEAKKEIEASDDSISEDTVALLLKQLDEKQHEYNATFEALVHEKEAALLKV